MTKDQVAKSILGTISGQRFAEWYTKGNFDQFIRGDMEHETGKSFEECVELIQADIVKIFHLDLVTK